MNLSPPMLKIKPAIIYSLLVLCGVGCAFLGGKLGDHQFYLIATPQIPQNGLLAPTHSLQTDHEYYLPQLLWEWGLILLELEGY